MNIYEFGIMDKLVYHNTIIEKTCKSLACGGRALRGLIRAENSQGGQIAQGATEISGTLN